MCACIHGPIWETGLASQSRFKLESDHPRLNFICQSELSSNWKRILYERQSIEQTIWNGADS